MNNSLMATLFSAKRPTESQQKEVINFCYYELFISEQLQLC